MAHIAEGLKEEGNRLFREGNFEAAEVKYTAAITRYSQNPLLFTNRAFARLKLQRWEGVVDDCLKSIEIHGHNGFSFKSFFYLGRMNCRPTHRQAQAQLALHHPNEALASALTAYDQLLHPPTAEAAKATSNLGTCSELVLKCKKAKFAARERERLLRRGDILAELEETYEQVKRRELSRIETELQQGQLGVVEASDQRQEVLDSTEKKVGELRSVFAVADPHNHQAREVPDHLVDTITFEIMHDPVITKTGHSYERATLLEHLKHSATDPLTRDPLTAADLRPNIALRHTLEDFWKTAGSWAVEW